MTAASAGPVDRLRRGLARLLGLVPVLDLHGLGVADAVRATERFLEEASAEGREQVRIVYGKGRRGPGGVGALRVALPDLVAARTGGIVLRFERQVESDGHDGSMRVWLRPRRDRPGADVRTTGMENASRRLLDAARDDDTRGAGAGAPSSEARCKT